MLGLIAGCSASRASSAVVRHDAWVREQGGVIPGAKGLVYQQRVRTAVARLKGGSLSGAPVRVLNCDDAAAYAWPDGSIFATRGLVDLLSEDELAAALAHEMGHLISDGWMQPPVALSGRPAATDCEMRADDMACVLLRNSGMDAETLSRALQRVAGTMDRQDPCRRSLAARIARLGSDRQR